MSSISSPESSPMSDTRIPLPPKHSIELDAGPFTSRCSYLIRVTSGHVTRRVDDDLEMLNSIDVCFDAAASLTVTLPLAMDRDDPRSCTLTDVCERLINCKSQHCAGQEHPETFDFRFRFLNLKEGATCYRTHSMRT
jgi:hypothetical protein